MLYDPRKRLMSFDPSGSNPKFAGGLQHSLSNFEFGRTVANK
jgi:hypothetical protein